MRIATSDFIDRVFSTDLVPKNLPDITGCGKSRYPWEHILVPDIARSGQLALGLGMLVEYNMYLDYL